MNSAQLGRITAVVALVCNKENFLLVRNKKGGNWIFPQGGFDEEIDEILSQTARRECIEELRLNSQHLYNYEVSLGACTNEKGKYLCFLAIPVRRMDVIVLDDSENDKFEWVRSWPQFRALVEPTAAEHPLKTTAMIEAIDLMIENKVLHWPSRGEIVN